MRELPNSPVLIVSSATEANAAYFAAQLERAGQNARRSAAFTKEVVHEVREEERVLYSKCVVRGWYNVKDKTGVEVLFTPDNCLEFLRAIPVHIFDDLRAFCSAAFNFVTRADEGKS